MPTLDDPINVIDPSTVSARPVGMKWGLIWGGAAIVVGLVGYLTGLSKPTATPSAATYLVSLVSFVISIICVVKAIQEHRTELGGYIRGGRCATVGLWTGLFYGVIAALWSLIFFNFIAPDFFDELYSSMTVMWEEQGLNDEQIENALGMTQMFQGPVGMVLMSLFGGAIAGLIVGAIAGLFMKKKAPGQF